MRNLNNYIPIETQNNYRNSKRLWTRFTAFTLCHRDIQRNCVNSGTRKCEGQ